MRLQPDTYHVFPLSRGAPVGSIRLDTFPDGGISRVRVIGSIEPAARHRAGYRWFNSLPTNQALVCLLAAGLPADRAADVVGLRPLRETWLEDEHGEAGARRVQGMTPTQLRQLTALFHGAERS